MNEGFRNLAAPPWALNGPLGVEENGFQRTCGWLGFQPTNQRSRTMTDKHLPYYYTNGCRRSNDPSSSSLPVCHRTEYRCSDPDAAKDEEVSRTIRYRYTVQYSSSISSDIILRYLQETTLEHVAYGLNLMDCPPHKFLRNLAEDSPMAVAVTGTPRDTFTAEPECAESSCLGSVQGGVTVFAMDEPSMSEAKAIAEGSILEVMGLLDEPGTIERVEFDGFGVPKELDWYQKRSIQYGFGASLLLFLALCLCGVVCCCCRCRQRHSGKRDERRSGSRWQSLDEEQPIAQRDSLALRPQCSWMLRKARLERDGAVSEATGDLSNDQQHMSCDSVSTDEGNGISPEEVAEHELEAPSSSMDVADQESDQDERVETDPYILNEVSDDDSEVVKQWRNMHIIEAGSTQGYDEEIAEVLGHISFDDSDR